MTRAQELTEQANIMSEIRRLMSTLYIQGIPGKAQADLHMALAGMRRCHGITSIKASVARHEERRDQIQPIYAGPLR